MPPISPTQIIALQRNSEQIRNICILAHVDHGKTSLSDCLLATNGIVSPKMVGRVRYLDARPDEQLRGITMESSAISLFFRLMRREAEGVEPIAKDYLINLIDSPGHIDFSSEVSTASRLCDGAVVLVDAVEGVCSQTVTVLRQTWIEHIRPVLVINKIDRLITELQLSPDEAFDRLTKLVEQVNAVVGSFFAGERMEEDLKWRETLEAKILAAGARQETDVSAPGISGAATPTEGFEEKDDEDLYFAPERHNVIFSSAYDGWAFTIRQFAAIYEKKLGIKKPVLEKVLWGKFYFDPKTKRVLGEKHLKGRKLKPMFVQLILDNIWAVYQCTVLNKDQEKVEKIVKSLGLKILPRDLRSKDTRALLSTIFMQWLPLSTALLVTVIEQLPSPPMSQKTRMPLILQTTPGSENIAEPVKNAMVNFETDETVPIIAYVSKMVAVPASELKKTQRVQLTAEEMREMGRQKTIELARKLAVGGDANGDVSSTTDALNEPSLEDKKEGVDDTDQERLIGFARLYSGTIKVGQELCVLGPKYSPLHPDEHMQKFIVTELYYMMGKELESLEEVPAGNVFGIGGLEGKLLKNGTLCSVEKGAVNLAGVNLGASPIVRVALEPKNPSQMSKMIEGLKLLEQADPCAEYIVQDNGEHVILTAGELHLERCLKDLRERFAKVDIQASAPIVPFRETIVSAAEMSPPKDPNLLRGRVVAVTPSKQVSIRIRTRPLPTVVTEFLVQNSTSIKSLYSKRFETQEDQAEINEEGKLRQSKAKLMDFEEFQEGLRKAFEAGAGAKEREIWANVVDKLAAFGPRRVGPNLLIDFTPDGIFRKLLQDETQKPPADKSQLETLSARDFEDKITHAFQLATSAGPLCNEPVQGIACFVEAIAVNATEGELLENARARNFEVITAIQNAIRQGFLDWSPRLMLAMYSCDVQASTEVLGKVHDTIHVRRGRSLGETQEEGNPFWTVKALIPVIESFGFADEIRKRTSGAASPQLIFYGYEVLDEDPFWIPFTEEELEDLGELSDKANVAKKYMDEVRTRKGLFVQRKLVAAANKQKNLKR